MPSTERALQPNNDTLNPPPPRFGMPWFVIMGIVTASVGIFMLPGCKIVGLLLTPTALATGWWITKDDAKEFQLIVNDILLSSSFDPGK